MANQDNFKKVLYSLQYIRDLYDKMFPSAKDYIKFLREKINTLDNEEHNTSPFENLNEIKSLNIPFGFKLNGFVRTNPKPNYTGAYNKSKTGNPNEFLGVRKDLTPEKMLEFAKKFKDAGATIIGGCCETTPLHIKAFSKLK